MAGALAALVIAVFWRRWQFLAASPYPFGVDGYWYPIQLRGLLAGDGLYYPSAPLALWLAAPLAAFTDPITGAKLLAALAGAVLPIPIYMVGRRVAGGRREAGLLAAALVASSAESFYLATEFVKNAVGISLLAGYLGALGAALERPTRRRLALTAVLLLAAWLTHKSAGALALAFSVWPLWRRRPDRRRLLAAGGLAAALLIGLLGLGLLADLFTASPDLTLPALRGLHFGHEVAIAAALSALVLFAARGAPRSVDGALALGPALFALLIAFPFLDAADPQGLVFRLRLLAFVPLALGAAYLIGRVPPRVPAAARAALTIGFAVGLLIARPLTSREGVVGVHPSLQAAVQALRGAVPAGAVVIARERHLVYMVTWYTGLPCRLRAEPVAPGRRWRLLLGRRLGPELKAALEQARAAGLAPRALGPRDPFELVLVSESTWSWLLDHLEPAARARYEAWRSL